MRMLFISTTLAINPNHVESVELIDNGYEADTIKVMMHTGEVHLLDRFDNVPGVRGHAMLCHAITDAMRDEPVITKDLARPSWLGNNVGTISRADVEKEVFAKYPAERKPVVNPKSGKPEDYDDGA